MGSRGLILNIMSIISRIGLKCCLRYASVFVHDHSCAKSCPVVRAALSLQDDMQYIHAVCWTTSAENVDSFLLFQWSTGKPLQADF